MRNLLVGIAILFAGATAFASAEVVRVSDFGFDAADSTEIVQRALDSGVRRIVFDRKSGPWVVRPLFVRSNSEIVFEEGVELLAKRGEFLPVMDALMTLEGVTNVVLRGLGKGATFRMWGDDYRQPPYKHSEWRHALNLLSVRQVTVENLTFRASGGDGIYLGEKVGPNVDVVVRDCVCDANHRQGISVITARNLLIERTTLKNTRGTDPETGIDFEPNGQTQELVNCLVRDCTIERNAHVGCWFNLSHFTDMTKPVSVTLENCRILGNEGSAFMLGLNSAAPDERLPRGGFIRVKNCTLGGKGPAALFSTKLRGCVDTTFEDCVFDRCCSGHPNQPDVAFLVFDRQKAYDDGIAFRNVTIRQGREREWFGAANRPWVEPPTAISGNVTVVSPAGTKREKLDATWIRKHFAASADEHFDFTHVGLDPDAARPVDHAPGRAVALSPLSFRWTFRTWVYADGPREIDLRAVQETIGSRKPVTGSVPVLSVDGRKVAEIPVPSAAQTDLRFKVPAAGFYSMRFDTKGNSIAFLSADVPLGIVPDRSSAREQIQLDIYRSAGTLFFRHAKQTPSILFVGGGGPEYAAMKVADPAGKVVFEDKALGQWGFVKVGGKPTNGLYRIDVNRPEGLNWEDTFVDLRGEPAVFFLTSEKHW